MNESRKGEISDADEGRDDASRTAAAAWNGQESIRGSIEGAARAYGKVGLLLDDSPGCEMRVARALYGLEALPAWWTVVRSMRCGYYALEAFLGLLGPRASAGESSTVRGIVIVDRYLPWNCDGGRALPWDSPGDVLDRDEAHWPLQLRKVVPPLLDHTAKDAIRGEARQRFAAFFVTSFPTVSASPGARQIEHPLEIPWQARSLELFQEERQMLQTHFPWRRLLRYGPENDAEAAKESAYGGQDFRKEEDRWRAKSWLPSLRLLAGMLRERKPVVLITGAGCSISADTLSAGTRPTSEMIAEVCRRLGSGAAPNPDNLLQPRQKTSCVGERPVDERQLPTQRWQSTKDAAPVPWLLQAYNDGKLGDLLLQLEVLFDPERHSQAYADFQRFHEFFRETLYEADHGFAHHHWLIARLPWSFIITTNFDRFHERAAEAVARIPNLESRQRYAAIQLGKLWDRSAESAVTTGRLSKPYGSLSSLDGFLALSHAEVTKGEARLREPFEYALREVPPKAIGNRSGALVVLGHAMQDTSMRNILKVFAENLQGMEILWVTPDSVQRCLDASANQTEWEGIVKARKDDWDAGGRGQPGSATAGSWSGPLPARAHEFIADLWLMFKDLDEESRAR